MSTKWLIEFFVQELRRKLAGLIRDNKELEERLNGLQEKREDLNRQIAERTTEQ